MSINKIDVNNYPLGAQNISIAIINTLYPTTLNTDFTYNSIDTRIIEDIPTIFTIISTKIIDSKLINIKYKEVDPRLNSLNNYGNIYISSGIFGIYNKSDNFYWKNEIIIEVESEECIEKIQPGMKFINATQWEKKLSIKEIIDMINNPLVYYIYVHDKLEQYIADNSITVRIEKHRAIDKLYDLE